MIHNDVTEWRVPNPEPETVSALAQATSLPPLIARLLVNRNVRDSEAVSRFLNPSLKDLRDPSCLPNLEKAVDRLERALKDNERIFVHGDYDADGVTSAALCQRALSGLGADLVVYVPRRTDGYDLQIPGVERAKAAGASLILTADCGVCAVGAVARANELGMDVIITDHHRPAPTLPDAVAIVNPHLDGCDLPFKDFCGAHVAYKVLSALVARVAPHFLDTFRHTFVDLVALGTVADVTPILDDNRILVYHGLRVLAEGKKTGLRALLISLNLFGKPLTARNLSWNLGPRLNAAGRMEDADLAYRLLTTRDPDEAEQLAVQLEALHDKTREETSRVTTEAMAEALLPEHAGRRVLVLARDAWGKSVVGIAASRIVEQCQRPVILLSYDRENNFWQGSARSFGNFNLHMAFQECAPLLGRFGGHSGAAGVSLPAANLEAFRDRLHELAEGFVTDEPVVPVLDVDAEVDGSEWDLAMMEQLERLAPFGHGNPEPVFVTRGAIAQNPTRMGKEGAHFRMDVQLPGLRRAIKAVSFGDGDLADRLSGGDEVDIAYTPQINEWNGRVSIELMLKGLKTV